MLSEAEELTIVGFLVAILLGIHAGSFEVTLVAGIAVGLIIWGINP